MEDKKETALPTSVTLSDGKVITTKRARVKALAQAENQPKGKEWQMKYAQIAEKIMIDDKPAVLEDVLDMYEDDLELVLSLFPDLIKNE